MKRIIALSLIGATLLLAGCTAKTETEGRFTYERTEGTPGASYIITDTETDVQYLFIDGKNHSTGLVKLEPKPEPATDIYVGHTPEPEPEPELTSIGEFTVTAYCCCKKCCGKDPDHPAYGITASGTTATEGRTIAVDPDTIPYGTEVMFEGPDGMHTYIAEDTGNIGERQIDLFIADHQEALVWGVQTREVFVKEAF